MLEQTIELVEGTTRYEELTCKDQDGNDFDFTGYDVRTWLSFGGGMYVPTVVAGNIVSYEIPAAASVGCGKAKAETRIFKDGKVYEILRLNIRIIPAEKPDLEPVELGGATE